MSRRVAMRRVSGLACARANWLEAGKYLVWDAVEAVVAAVGRRRGGPVFSAAVEKTRGDDPGKAWAGY